MPLSKRAWIIGISTSFGIIFLLSCSQVLLFIPSILNFNTLAPTPAATVFVPDPSFFNGVAPLASRSVKEPIPLPTALPPTPTPTPTLATIGGSSQKQLTAPVLTPVPAPPAAVAPVPVAPVPPTPVPTPSDDPNKIIGKVGDSN